MHLDRIDGSGGGGAFCTGWSSGPLRICLFSLTEVWEMTSFFLKMLILRIGIYVRVIISNPKSRLSSATRWWRKNGNPALVYQPKYVLQLPSKTLSAPSATHTSICWLRSGCRSVKREFFFFHRASKRISSRSPLSCSLRLFPLSSCTFSL